MIRIGDYVTRKSYMNDIVFKVIDVKGDNYILCGACIRLMADSPRDDLVLYTEKVDEDDFEEEISYYKTLDRTEYFYLPGKVLHIDTGIYFGAQGRGVLPLQGAGRGGQPPTCQTCAFLMLGKIEGRRRRG